MNAPPTTDTYEPVMTADDVGKREHVPDTVTQKSLNDDILKLMSKPGKIWWTIFLIDLAILAVGMLAERNQIFFGVGVAGHTRPVMWASYGAR